ncbi:ABC-F family ATP-binding cassette domain-containing protein [Actinospica sp. MGRD01-02]|uniref:ABC-F family ATP-binding cassette domain-containing protein n=1 Tax=Actinospica acidithermotolerans TaxID=2828514 RepID=A0A941EC87_9ACTN|nr:ABC-F family ATP-binding cassette domain-containing protein [Actinospica acidithermotolerans]MBR7827710.1 ABC-F family ATP-binding cassette domain-containing protein [Actinospica acidithermotolerans]
MANLVNIEAVSKAYGTRTLLDGVSLGLAEGDRIGVVGRNGGGKSTLLKLLARQEQPDAGRVVHSGGTHLAVVGQHDELDPAATIRAQLLGGREEHEWAGQAQIRDVITGLFGGLDAPGFPQGLDTVVGPLSGGERRRIALAKALIEPDSSDLLILLDEPTNHLDVEGIAWLARHLRQRRSALFVVTHDRWFLDEVCDHTWEVAGGQVHAYEGGYSAFILARAERARIAEADWDRKQNLLRKELAWLRRGAPARTSKPKFRIEAANALIDSEPPARDSAELTRFASARLGRTVYELEDVSYRVGAGDTGRTLLEHVTWQLGPGERVGLVGVNGAGKTSLMRLLTGAVQPAAGRVVTGVTVKPAVLSQEITEIDPNLKVLKAVEEIKSSIDLGKGREMTASQLLERFGFAGEKQWTPVGDLSGGERRRLQLLRLLMGEPNVLLLDEPTNDLDIDTLRALEDLLDGWPGSLLVISHDRYFLERATDHIVALLGDGTLRMLPGGVDEYLQRRAAAAAPAPASATAAAPSSSSAKDQRAAQKDMARIERRLDRISGQEKDLHDQMAAAATDYAKIADLDAKLRELTEERERLEEEWLLLAD